MRDVTPAPTNALKDGELGAIYAAGLMIIVVFVYI
jgi:hypothetical protein